jgi:hypothetical protein
VISPETEALVTAKLADSMALHRAARQQTANPKGEGNRTVTKPKDLTKYAKAFLLRQEAHELDPKHEASAWAIEQAATPAGRDTHSELMAFYKDLGLT